MPDQLADQVTHPGQLVAPSTQRQIEISSTHWPSIRARFGHSQMLAAATSAATGSSSVSSGSSSIQCSRSSQP